MEDTYIHRQRSCIVDAYSNLNRPIVVVDYDPNWPALYEAEKAHILAALGTAVVQIEHIGSTAVPGLAAKPTIDIGVGIVDLSFAPSYIPILEGLGYIYVPETEVELPARRFFWKGTAQSHIYHISMAEPGSSVWVRPLLFRDYLRAHPDEVQRYMAVKRDLALACGSDIQAYITGKTALIESILVKAALAKEAERR
jgi:GrpB-like predicted nucleotidyltransferase (UPF0157 family)